MNEQNEEGTEELFLTDLQQQTPPELRFRKVRVTHMQAVLSLRMHDATAASEKNTLAESGCALGQTAEGRHP